MKQIENEFIEGFTEALIEDFLPVGYREMDYKTIEQVKLFASLFAQYKAERYEGILLRRKYTVKQIGRMFFLQHKRRIGGVILSSDFEEFPHFHSIICDFWAYLNVFIYEGKVVISYE